MSNLPTSSNPNIDIIPNQRDFSITLDHNTFADIILNFLGKKERLTYEVDEYFVLTHNQLEQFYFLIKEKVDRENNTIIDSFSVDILYDDKTSRQINGIEALQIYTENRDVAPHAVTATWHIINKSRDLSGVEHVATQRIEISFVTGNIPEAESNIRINIESTNQAWANETLFTLQGHIAKIRTPHNKSIGKILHNILSLEWILSNYKEKQGNITFLDLLLPLVMAIFISSNIISYPINENSLNHTTSTELLSKKYNEINQDILIKNINTFTSNEAVLISGLILSNNFNKEKIEKLSINTALKEKFISNLNNEYKDRQKEEDYFSKRKYTIILSTTITFILIYIWIKISNPYYEEKSFILITDKSKKVYEKFIASKSKLQFITLSVVISTIIIGLIINTSYEIIHEYIFLK